jgi:hypothetical protein
MNPSISMLAVAMGLALLACSEADDSHGSRQAGASAGPDPALLLSCARWCALVEIFKEHEPCTPGDAYEHGVPLLEERPAEPPVSEDQACIDDCAELPNGYCWQKAAADTECMADALWVCDAAQGWGSPTPCNADPKECSE